MTKFVSWLNEWFQAVYFYWHIIPYMVKHMRGRWFVFRDAPDWLVETAAYVYDELNKKKPCNDPVLISAKHEWNVRQGMKEASK